MPNVMLTRLILQSGCDAAASYPTYGWHASSNVGGYNPNAYFSALRFNTPARSPPSNQDYAQNAAVADYC